MIDMTNEPTQISKFILYTSPSGEIKLDVFIRDETLWLTQKMMSELFGVEISAISKQLANIFESGELEEDSVVSILETTASDSKIFKTKFSTHDPKN